MISKNLLCASLLAAVAGCASPTDDATSPPTLVGGKADAINGLASCAGLPAGFGSPTFLAYKTDTGTVYVPTNVTSASNIWVVFESNLPTYYGAQSASLHQTSDNWKTTTDTALAAWCTVTNADGATVPMYGQSLGKLATGATVAFDIHQTPPTDYYRKDVWINNGGKNYSFTISQAAALSWVGGASLGYGGITLDNTSVPVGQALTVSAQSYPAGAGVALTASWVDSAGKSGSTPLVFSATGAGQNGDNDAWTATLPAALDGGAFSYFISATDATGKTLRDVPAGSETQVTPKSYPVSWAGNLGTLTIGDGENNYAVGAGIGKDGTITTGCSTGGADYVPSHAVQVYIPGITDRTFTSSQQTQAFASMIRATVLTNASKTGTVPMAFAEQTGHNFVYTFFQLDTICAPGGPEPFTDGTYAYKLELSTDGGATEYKLGSSAGGDGGNDLSWTYKQSASYM